MHKLMGKVKEEIDSIVDCGITPESLCWLGELVDIAKDVENINYWKEEMHEEKGSIEELIGDLMIAYKHCEDEPTPANRAKVAELAWCLLSKAKLIKEALQGVTLAGKELTEHNRIFK